MYNSSYKLVGIKDEKSFYTMKLYNTLLIILGLVIPVVISYLAFAQVTILHGDQAAHYVLATAMWNENSMIPHLFNYGNQLILIRNNIFIALALGLGFSGYEAYFVGATVALVFWFFVIYMSLYSVNKSLRNSLLVVSTVFLLLLLNGASRDYIITQQSHLANVALAFVFISQFYKFITERQKISFILSILTICLIALEEPARAYLILAPFLLGITLIFGLRKIYKPVLLGMPFIIAAIIINKVIDHNISRAYKIWYSHFNKGYNKKLFALFRVYKK